MSEYHEYMTILTATEDAELREDVDDKGQRKRADDMDENENNLSVEEETRILNEDKINKNDEDIKVKNDEEEEKDDYNDDERENESPYSWNRLPDLPLLRVFDFLSIPDKVRLELVCKRWLRLSRASWTNLTRFSSFETVYAKKYDRYARREGG